MKKRLTIIVAVLFFVLTAFYFRHLSLLKSNFNQNIFDKTVIGLYQPLFKGFRFVQDKINQTIDRYFYLVGVAKQNELLQHEITLMQNQLWSLQQETDYYRQALKDITSYKKINFNKAILARILTYNAHAATQMAWISKGSQDEIAVDDTVVAQKGLVGRVIRVYERTAQILLLTDASFSVDVMNSALKYQALFVGQGKKHAGLNVPVMGHLEYLQINATFNQGDLLITSGKNGPYPQGIPVGSVAEITLSKQNNQKQYVILPEVDMTQLKQVVVLKK